MIKNYNSNALETILNKFEIKLVCGIFNSKDDLYEDLIKNLSSSGDDQELILCELIQKVSNRKYKDILNMKFEFLKPFKFFFRKASPLWNFKNGQMECNFSHLINAFDTEFSYVKQLILMIIAISALEQFTRANYCGPKISEDSYNVLSIFPDEIYTNERVLDELSRNCETVLMKISQAKLLYLSLILFNADKFRNCITHKWWLFRCLFIQQRITPEAIPDLYYSIAMLVKQQRQISFLKGNCDKTTQVMFLVECAHIHLHYHEVNLAESCIKLAGNILDLNIDVYKGVRNSAVFQNEPVASSVNNNKKIPTTFQAVLDKIESLINDCNMNDVSTEEQMVILAYCSLTCKKMSTTNLKNREVMGCIHFILLSSMPWTIQFKAIRCQTEKLSTKTFYFSPFGDWISIMDKSEPEYCESLVALYCVNFPFKFDLEKLHADIQMNIYCPKYALDIFERIHLWEEAIVCYKQLKMTSKAAKVLETLIAPKPSPVHWCYLGDVTEDPQKYEIAWELSQHKSARSQRSLGYYYFKKKDYEKCLPHFLLSIEINHLQPSLWFTIGDVATLVEKYELAAKAYRQVVHFDDDNFEAWNNLSNAYIKLKQMDRAWRSIQKTLKLNYEDCRVWENFLIVCADVRAFKDVILAFNRLIDLKGKYVDAKVSRTLVNAIDKNLPDIHGLSSLRYRDNALELFQRMTAAETDNADLWEQYATLICSGTEYPTIEVLKRALDFQVKAVNLCIKNSTLDSELNAVKVIRLSAQHFATLSCLKDPADRQQLNFLVKFILQRFMNEAVRYSSNFLRTILSSM